MGGAVVAGLAGCGIPGKPSPPSLHLPKPIGDLTASRVGDRVNLHFTAPSETTDGLRLQAPVALQIRRRAPNGSRRSLGTLGPFGPWRTAETISIAPGKAACYRDTLPAALTRGPFREMQYEVLALNRHGRSAGPSNVAAALAGEAPPAVRGLSATTVERGVLLHWLVPKPISANVPVRLRRTLLGPAPGSQSHPSAGVPPAASGREQTLRVATPGPQWKPGVALDATAAFGKRYRYRAARVATIRVGNLRLQAESAPSAPVTIVTRDVFPPAAPKGLAAAPVPASLGHGRPEVDLSWSPNTEPDLAGYLVYRRPVSAEAGADGAPLARASVAPTRIAPAPNTPGRAAAPLVAPAFRDRNVQPGQTYLYSVAAVDRAGNVSARSPEIRIAVPPADSIPSRTGP